MPARLEAAPRDIGAKPLAGCARDATLITNDSRQPVPVMPKIAVAPKIATKTAPKTRTRTKTERPPLYKVILFNDDYTPREFVVMVLKAVFRMTDEEATRVMLTAHQQNACVVAVYTRDVAETRAKEATDMGRQNGFPLFFGTEKEE